MAWVGSDLKDHLLSLPSVLLYLKPIFQCSQLHASICSPQKQGCECKIAPCVDGGIVWFGTRRAHPGAAPHCSAWWEEVGSLCPSCTVTPGWSIPGSASMHSSGIAHALPRSCTMTPWCEGRARACVGHEPMVLAAAAALLRAHRPPSRVHGQPLPAATFMLADGIWSTCFMASNKHGPFQRHPFMQKSRSVQQALLWFSPVTWW